MAVLRWDPWGELAALQRDVNELFGRNQAPASTRAAAASAGLVPPIDAFRTADELVVRMELPGIDPEHVDVSVEEGMLVVAGERTFDADVEEDAWVRRERAIGTFQRSFNLPEGTDPQAITASFNHGLLELRIPHPPERKPHKVKIGTGAGNDQAAVDVGTGE
jgi:HSP20 family protein